MSREMPVDTRALFPSGTFGRPPGDRLANRILAYSLLGFVLVFPITKHAAVSASLSRDLAGLGIWTAMVVLVNLFPVRLKESTFTMDMPMLIAVAILYPPETATLVALVASLDVRELRAKVSLTRALFNRSQIALLVLIAGWLFHRLAGSPTDWIEAILAVLLATAASLLLNIFLVNIYTGLRLGQPLVVTLRSFREESLGEFAVTYVAYCGLALVLAYLFLEVGVWSLLLFLAPTFVAQLMLSRGRALKALTDDLKGRERLFEQLSDRIVDERRDERRRIAGDLHDEVLQSLIRISQLGAFLRSEVPAESQAYQDADELGNLARSTVDELRRVVSDLQQSPLGRGGLVPTLQGLARELQLVWRTRVELRAVVPPQLAPAQQILAYQMIKEAMLNALKHAHASQIEVEVGAEGGQFMATVKDNGRGFVPDDVNIRSQFGIGLMQERARLSGSTVYISSEPDKGTLVRIVMSPA